METVRLIADASSPQSAASIRLNPDIPLALQEVIRRALEEG